MSIAAPVLETPDPNSIDTLPITVEEVVVSLVQQVDRAQKAADGASNWAEEAANEAAQAEAHRVAALASQTAAAASAAAAAATLASVDEAFDDETAVILAAIESAKNAGITAIQTVATVAPAMWISVTASRTLLAGWAYALDAAGGTVELTLPVNPSPGDAILFADFETVGFGPTYVIKRNGKTIKGQAEDMTIDVQGCAFTLRWNGLDWRIL